MVEGLSKVEERQAPPGSRRGCRAALWAVLCCGLPQAALAQREPVLKQVKLPHNYYYREMYLPQVTSGPSAATWSPDGTTLIYSMQGSLWRQVVGDSVAEQLTTGPGYDYQPDWSPDGSTVVYASYHDDAVELRLLDVTTLVSAPLLADGAVNVEPRWSPIGGRIGFVSTAYQGRFHIFVLPLSRVAGAGPRYRAAGPAERLTEDVDSGLPRYYYSRYDHYLSPAWSPDGREILLVSNRGRTWGTGGLWRMEAVPGATLHQVQEEESTWRMRPDWAPDGRRIAYASYLGRQWHQLWLTSVDGARAGDPLQLTYGEFDATEPRWSPDGRHIAYISNEGGNTRLMLVSVPGGERQPVLPLRRVFREPVGRLRITVTDSATGRPLPVRISVTLADGRSAAPDDAWRHADDGFDRAQRRFEVGYFHSAGESTLTAPVGWVRVEVTHGPEYRVFRDSVRVTSGAVTNLRPRMRRLTSLPGWTSGDLHVHMNYGGHYRATPATLARQARAEGLNLVENLIVNKEDRMPDIGYFTGRPDPVSSANLLLLHDQEYHTSWWGHTGALGLTDHILLPGYAGYAGTPAWSLFPDNATVAELTHRQGGLYGYVRPFDTDPDPADTITALTNALPVDVALGQVDYLEVVGFSDHLATSRVWYRLLNCGFRLPAGAGTDAMTNFASLRGPVGTDRVYVQSPVPLDRQRWYAALRAGKSFATNGPLLQFEAGGVGIGGEVQLPATGGPVRLHLVLNSIVPIDHLELVGNGEVVATIPLHGDRTHADTSVTLTVHRSGWYLLRAWSEQAREPILDIYPFGSTSPIYVSVGGAPVRNGVDAAYFLAWINRLEAAVEAHSGWNASAERREVLGRIQAARAEFERRRPS